MTFRLQHNRYGYNNGYAEITPGVLDADAEVAFSRGHCHAMALALHEATGWPIIAGFYEENAYELAIRGELTDEWDDPGHFAVRRPDDGYIVDVFGANHPDTEVVPGWGCGVWVDTTPERIHEFVEWGCYLELDDGLPAARSLVPEIMAKTMSYEYIDEHSVELT